VAEIDPKLAKQLNEAPLSKEEAFNQIATGKKKKKGEQQWGDDFIEELNLSISRMRSRVPLKNLVFFTRQLATMFAAGLTLEKAMTNLAAEEKHTSFKKTLENVAEDLEKAREAEAE
jgi:type II secretory pathway component PulF